MICVSGGNSVVSANTQYSISEVTNCTATEDVLAFASATGLNLDGFDSTTLCTLDFFLEMAKANGESQQWVLKELQLFLVSRKSSNTIIDNLQKAKDDIIDHQKEMIGDVLKRLDSLTHTVQRMERLQLRNNKKTNAANERLGTIAEGVAFTRSTIEEMLDIDMGDVEAKPPASEVLNVSDNNTTLGDIPGLLSSALPPRPSGPPGTVIATAIGSGGAVEDSDDVSIVSTGGRSIGSTSSGRTYKSLCPPGWTHMQVLASRMEEGMKSNPANDGDASNRATGAPRQEQAFPAGCGDTATDRPALILEPISAGRTAKARSDGSTDEPAVPGTDNLPLLAVTNTASTTDDITTVVGAGAAPGQAPNAFAVTTNDTKAAGVDAPSAHDNTNISMVMASTSNESGLISEDDVDPPGPSPAAAAKSGTAGHRSVSRLMASAGAVLAETPPISLAARTGVGGKKVAMRGEDEKENSALPPFKSKTTTRGLATSVLTDNVVSLDVARHVVESKAKPSEASGERVGNGLKLSRQMIDDLCAKVGVLAKEFPESHHDVIPEIKTSQITMVKLLSDGVFLSSKATRKFCSFLVTNVTGARLNPSQPSLCRGWKDVAVALVQQVHIVCEDDDVCDQFQKLIAPSLHSLCQAYLDPLKSSVAPVRLNSREAVRHLMTLLKYKAFSDMLVPICSGLLTGVDHNLQESCAQILLYAAALGHEANFLKVESGRLGILVIVGKDKIAKGLVSKAIVAGMCAPKDYVRRDTRVAASRLFARKELGQIKSAVENELPEIRQRALEASTNYCNNKWTNEGEPWCIENGYLPRP